jgi:hypothetical protein
MSLGDIHSHSSIVTSAQRRQKLELFGVKHITVKMSLWPMERQVTMKLSLLYWLPSVMRTVMLLTASAVEMLNKG